MGVDGLKKQLAELEKKGGGVLFVDEAYQLDPATELLGKRVLDYLLTELENHTDQFAFAFAGYRKQMDKLLEHNTGLKSRFPVPRLVFKTALTQCRSQVTLEFEDYDYDQLLLLLQSNFQRKYAGHDLCIEGGLDGKFMRILARRLNAASGTDGFGNARAVVRSATFCFSTTKDRSLFLIVVGD